MSIIHHRDVHAAREQKAALFMVEREDDKQLMCNKLHQITKRLIRKGFIFSGNYGSFERATRNDGFEHIVILLCKEIK